MTRYVAMTAAIATCIGGGLVRAEESPPLTYEEHIRPILRVHCFHCHGDDGETRGGLDLRLRRSILAGGESGPAIVPGNPARSLLLELIRAEKMPKKGKPLPASAVDTIDRWIGLGAPTAGPEPQDPSGISAVREEDRLFWSFEPVRRPPVPAPRDRRRVANPVDAFLLKRLESAGLSYSPEADRRTLIRRVSFDLIGLPPAPAQVDAFMKDASPDAYERLIDRLLDSPQYGERWGRHWLDVAGYADSEGYSVQDPVRPFAWAYRDYVIRALNADKPWDRFIVEQIAGDELVPPPWLKLSAEQQDLLAATGFLRMAPDGTATAGADVKVAANDNIAETLKIVSTSLLGLSVGCAQCHSHKYDPIPQTDYYRLRAIFEPALNPGAWRPPAQRLHSVMADEDRQKAAAIEAEAAKVEQERADWIQQKVAQVLEKELAKVPAELKEKVLAIRDVAAAQRTEEQQALAKQFFSVVNLNAGTVSLYDSTVEPEVKKFNERVAAIRSTKPFEPFLLVCSEPADQPPPQTVVFHRGDPDQPRQTVTPGTLGLDEPYLTSPIPVDDPDSPWTGRRLAYARHLTSGSHPLVGRVLVNRIWMHHFGTGLVATPGDLGATGQRPTHPDLLDWLADEFVRTGWSLKRLHRLILTSAAYRQQSGRRTEAERIDPGNVLLWRMPVRRLEAEVLRDAALAIAGQLRDRQFGPFVPTAEDEFGQVIPGIAMTDGNGHNTPGRDLGGEELRRSIYLQVRRSKPLSVLDVFDLPQMEPNCELRTRSTVAPQSLLMLNNTFVIQAAERFAERLIRQAGSDPGAQIHAAWGLAYGRPPRNDEITAAMTFLDEQKALVSVASDKEQSDPTLRSRIALTSLCHALLASNELLYID